jgi:bifunctional UDP-N-acetylglucosamine pyrophosphorylase/glucosamine-1-phosphate N-acetyltransferase
MIIDAVILAAGKGKRMKSDLPKPLHPLLGKPLISYVLEAAASIVSNPPVIIIGHGGEQIQEFLGDSCRYAVQEELLGTGHALQQAEGMLKAKSDLVLVLYGDMPLIRTATLQAVLAVQAANPGPLTALTVIATDPRGFGRVKRDAEGRIQAVVEEAQASEEELGIQELNAGIYCFKADWLWPALSKLKLSPRGEYFLTDLVGIAYQEGGTVAGVQAEDPEELIGVNNQLHLAEAGTALRRRINRDWMLSGVALIDPETCYIDSSVKIGKDTTILPHTYLEGETEIGSDCVLGPGTRIVDSRIGNGCEIEFSVIEGSLVEDGVDVGPFSHLRKGSHLGPGVHVGNFGEIKESSLGKGSKMGHFSYLGNAQVGENVNIGAGTITCNYDGQKKNQTVIEDGAFIGSDSMLVAPVKIGTNATTGAGSVVTKDVPPDTKVVGVPARKISKKKG